AAWIYLRKKQKPFLEYADIVMFGYIPGWFFGRIGCFFVHDHPGRLTDFFLGVKFPGGVRHDLGLYDALLLGCIWLTLIVASKLVKNKPFHGFYMALTCLIYAPGRFFFDFLRIQESRMGQLTFAQYVCIGVFVLGGYFMARGFNKAKA
ncbi:MAG: prolipoprotein diacylglyceryl transferase, partial [Deltaproteobacteria bacterium]|nr:prolipoprotein diacylglyceryl transferase [Deltaproteobacteria bacterium]